MGDDMGDNEATKVEEFVAGLGLVGYCAGKAAQDRLTTQMAINLAKEDVFVGKVNVAATVRRNIHPLH